MNFICAWCGDKFGEALISGSHSICQSCFDKQISELAEKRRKSLAKECIFNPELRNFSITCTRDFACEDCPVRVKVMEVVNQIEGEKENGRQSKNLQKSQKQTVYQK